jgi:hypothetical protein
MKKAAVARVESQQKKLVLSWLLTPRLAKAAADAGVNENQGQSAISQNGSGAELQIPAEYARKKGKKGKKAVQVAGSTDKLRPKTSRK